MRSSDRPLIDDYVNKRVFIQTLTHYWIGTITDYDDKFIHIKDTYWISETGPLDQFMTKGTCEYIKGQTKQLIGLNTITNISEHTATLRQMKQNAK